MISPRSMLDNTAVSNTNTSRTVLYYSAIMAVFLTAMLVLSRVFLGDAHGGLIDGKMTLPLIAVAWISVTLVWRGNEALGAALMAVAIFIVAGLAITQWAGIGLFLAVNATLVLAGLFRYAMPQRFYAFSMGTITVAGIILLVTDLFWTRSRPVAPAPIRIALIIGTILFSVNLVIIIVRQFANYPLRGKLAVTFLAVTLIPLTALAILNQRNIRNVLIDNSNQNLLTAASQTVVIIDDFLENNLNDVGTEARILGTANDWDGFLSLTEEERAGSMGLLVEENVIDLLKTFRDKDPLKIASYALLDIEGQVMFAYPSMESNLDESDRSYFTKVLETGYPYISPIEFSPETGEGFLHFSAPVLSDTDQLVGVLRARYKASTLQTLITRSTGFAGGKSFAVLFDENHLYLAHGLAPDAVNKLVDLPTAERVTALQSNRRLPPLPLDELSTNLPELEENLNNFRNQPFFTAVDIATGKQINQGAVVVTRIQPWLVAFFQPQNVFLAAIQTQARFVILIVLALTSIISFIAVVVAGFIAKPIVQLDAVAARVAKGDLTAQAQVESTDEVGELARTFNLMTAQLRDLIGNLERRVTERTRALEISGEVSQKLSTILDQQELVKAVVNQVQSAFNYYHAHIYLFDETGENLVMKGGTGEAGRQMLANKHQIPAGKGLVGRAGKTNSVVLVPDVSREPEWLQNPLLPETKSEIAVPITSGDQVLGVLDVQQNVVGGIRRADADLLQSVANQVAVALQNARLFTQMQHLALREAQINDIGQRIQNTRTIDDAMQTAVRELGRMLDGKQTIVRLEKNLLEKGAVVTKGNGSNGR